MHCTEYVKGSELRGGQSVEAAKAENGTNLSYFLGVVKEVTDRYVTITKYGSMVVTVPVSYKFRVILTENEAISKFGDDARKIVDLVSNKVMPDAYGYCDTRHSGTISENAYEFAASCYEHGFTLLGRCKGIPPEFEDRGYTFALQFVNLNKELFWIGHRGRFEEFKNDLENSIVD